MERWKSEIKESAFYGLQVLIITLVIVNFVGRVSIVQGRSMEPHLHTGERIVVNLFAYRFQQPHRGNVIIFRCPVDTTKDYIKRVIGLPGETLAIQAGSVLINGAPLVEPYITLPCEENFGPIVIPQDSVFVMGDNRPNSEDSRVWGPVPDNLIRGQAALIFWPLPNFGPIQ